MTDAARMKGAAVFAVALLIAFGETAVRVVAPIRSGVYQPAPVLLYTLLPTSLAEYENPVVQRDSVVRNFFRDHHDADIAVAPESASARYKVALMSAVLRAIRDEAAARGVRFVVTVVPSAAAELRARGWLDHSAVPVTPASPAP